MTLDEIKKQVEDMKRRYRLTHSKTIEEEIDGEVKFVDLNIRFKVDKEEKKS